MNICLVSQEYPPDTHWGGIATYTRVLARGLTELGHRVHVVSRAVRSEGCEMDGPVVVHRVNDSPRSRWVLGLNNRFFEFQPIINFGVRVAEKVREIHHEEPIDLIESPETCAQAVAITLFQKKIPVVTRLHAPRFWLREVMGTPTTGLYRRRDLLEWLQTRCSQGVSAPTRAMAGIVQKRWGIKRVDVIPNFFDSDGYALDDSVYNKHLAGMEYILFFGRLEVLKGPNILSQTISGLVKVFPQLRIVYVGSDHPFGSGTMRAHIEEENKKNIENLVFLENLSHNLLYPIIENSKLVVLPSLWENFPYACLEAMHFGRVVIGTRGSGFEEIISDGISGVLADAGSPASLENRILTALQSMDLDRMGRSAKERAAEFEGSKVIPRMVEYYSRVIEKAA